MNYQQHPLSAAFPAMSAHDLQTLTDDIEVNGQREPIVLFEGLVIDGWHRYQACVALGLASTSVDLGDDVDPAAYVKSRNLHRRHLTGSQRAAAVVACSAWVPRGRPAKPAPGAGLSTAQLAREADVGERTIRQAKAAQSAGLGESVKSGKVTAKRAAEIAKLPAPQRAAAIDAPAAQAKPAEASSAARTTPQQVGDDANADFDPIAALEAAHADVERLTGEIAAAEGDDLKAEAMKWRRVSDQHQRATDDLRTRLASVEKQLQFLSRQLRRCGKAVGEEDTDRIAAAVEAFARKHKVVA